MPRLNPSAQLAISSRDARKSPRRWAADDDCLEPTDASYYYHQDVGSDVVLLTDEAGNVVERYAYTAYGQVTVLGGYDSTAGAELGNVRLVSGVGNPFLHQGLFRDVEAGSYQNRARQYHPRLGRFIQRDPLGYLDGANLYQYLGSSPNNFVDPSGLNSTLPSGDIPAGGIPAGGDEGIGGGWSPSPDDDEEEEEEEGWSGGYEAPPEWWRGSEFARKLWLVQYLWRLAEEHGWDTAWVDALIARIWADARMNVARLDAWLEFLRARSLYACWPQNPDKSYLREMAKFLAHNPDVPMPPDISEDEWRELFAGPDEWRPDWLVAWAVRNQNMNIEALIEKILGGVIFGGTIKTLFAAAAKEGGTTLVAAAPAAGQAAIFGGLAVYISFGGKALVARVILLIDDASALPPSDGPSDTIDPSWDYPGCPWREPLR